MQTGWFLRKQVAEPFPLLRQEEIPPAVQHGHADAKAGTEFFHSVQMEEVFCQHPQDEEKAIYRIWDDNIREYGMGMPAACTAQAQDTDLPIDCLSMSEVSHRARISVMGHTVAFGAAPWACLVFP